MASDAYTPTTTQDDSQFQGFITLYRTEREVAAEMPLPARGSLVATEWGDAFVNHTVIARGLVPNASRRIMWIQHMPSPVSFEIQETYNFSEDGTQLVRVYVMPRAKYLSGYDATYTAPPAVATLLALPDQFGDLGYCYTGETVDKIGTDPDSIFVAVTRVWLKKITERNFFDDSIDSNITETREIIPAGTGSASSSPGETVEIVAGNRFIDYKVTQSVDGFGTQKQLTTLIRDVPYRFPDLMKSARWVGCAAFADSSTAAASYSDSAYIDYELVEPTVGPYEARELRFLIANPDSLRASYPIQKIVTKRETIGHCRAWYIASTKGNSTNAKAEQLEVPASIHGDITVSAEDFNIGLGQYKNFLPATPGYADFQMLTSMNVGYETRKVGYGLYLVSVTQLNVTGIYNGQTVPFGTPGGSTGANDSSSTVIPPLAPTAVMASNNRTITGQTSTGSGVEVRARVGSIEIGKVTTDGNGNYTMPLTAPYYRDIVTAIVTARRNGVNSIPRNVDTFDLSPIAPSATVSTDLTTVSGISEPGATIDILVNASAQVATVAIADKRPQVLTLVIAGTITVTGAVRIDVTSVAYTGFFEFNAEFGKSADQLAQAATDAGALSAAAAHWTFTRSGSSLIATAIVTAPNDVTAELDMTDPNATGINPATSTITTPGEDPVTVITGGNAKIVVTSRDLAVSPQTVEFAVLAGDTPTQVASKGAAAANLSLVADKFTAGSSTNNFSLTASPPRAHDNLLDVVISDDTCTGLITSVSTITTPGATPATTITNLDGAWSYAFSPILTNGDTLSITATDDGGTSPATVVTASTTPPTLTSASFPALDYDTISGTASAASVVKAYVNDVLVGSATTSGGGTYNITLATPLVRGELVRVVATNAGTPTIQSASLYINAYDLDLEKPSYQYLDVLGFYGTAPAGATAIKIRNPGGSLTDVPILSPSRNFSFTLPGRNGETYEIFARYAIGDSDPVLETVAVVPLDAPVIEIYDRSRNTNLVPEGSNFRYRAPNTSRDGFLMYIAAPAGTTLANLLVNFPGQADASFVPASNNYRAYTTGAPRNGGTGIVDATWRGPMMYQGNAPPGTTNAQLKTIFTAQLPIIMEVVATATDGRQSTTTFTRAAYIEQFNNPDPIYA